MKVSENVTLILTTDLLTSHNPDSFNKKPP